jgi:phosphoribosylpyrophosphate synthetase
MVASPRLAAVVPSGQGRPGPHPLLGIVASCTDVPIVPLSAAPGAVARARGLADGVAVGWLTVGVPGGAPVGVLAGVAPGVPAGRAVAGSVAGADVLLVDDTWVSGGSAQSVAAALKAAGARRVALVVLGRHVDPADPRSAEFLRRLRAIRVNSMIT